MTVKRSHEAVARINLFMAAENTPNSAIISGTASLPKSRLRRLRYRCSSSYKCNVVRHASA